MRCVLPTPTAPPVTDGAFAPADLYSHRFNHGSIDSIMARLGADFGAARLRGRATESRHGAASVLTRVSPIRPVRPHDVLPREMGGPVTPESQTCLHVFCRHVRSPTNPPLPICWPPQPLAGAACVLLRVARHLAMPQRTACCRAQQRVEGRTAPLRRRCCLCLLLLCRLSHRVALHTAICTLLHALSTPSAGPPRRWPLNWFTLPSVPVRFRRCAGARPALGDH